MPEHDMDLPWEEIDRTHDQPLQEVVETIEGQMTIAGNLTLQTLVEDIRVKGEEGGDQDEDQTGHGPENRNLNFWRGSLSSSFLFFFSFVTF